MKKTCVILAALLMNAGVFGVSLAATVPDEIESRTLDNGLKIIVWPDHDIPNVVMYNFVRAGGGVMSIRALPACRTFSST